MYTASTTAPTAGPLSWFRRAESWLDARGRAAWIAAMVLGFVFAWPIGLGLLAYMIWSKRMFNKSRNSDWSCGDRHSRHHAARAAMRSSGNTAFDAYKTETRKRRKAQPRKIAAAPINMQKISGPLIFQRAFKHLETHRS